MKLRFLGAFCSILILSGCKEAKLPEAGFYNNAESSPILAMLNGAKHSLDIEVYQMEDRDVQAALRRALGRGVKIRVVKEPNPVGDSCNIFVAKDSDSESCLDQRQLRSDIIQTGGAYIPFAKAELCVDPSKPCVQHGKMIIADRRAVLISTGNFNSTSLCNLSQNPEKCNRDYSVVTRDHSILEFLGSVFAHDLQALRYELMDLFRHRYGLFQQPMPRRVSVSPLSLDPLVQLIRSARETIYLQNQYMKDPRWNQALIEAAQRGVRVMVTLASACSFGRPSQSEARALSRLLTPFEAAGIAIRMFPSRLKINGKPGYMHAKAIVVDGERAWVGSINGSNAAISNNREFGLFFRNFENVRKLEQTMRNDFDSPDTESWQESLDCLKDRD